MSRIAACVGCGRTFPVDTVTGPLPSKCDTCDPTLAKRREHRDRDRQAARDLALRRRRDAERLAYLEQALAGGRLPRLNPHLPAGRDTVAIAVRRVGHAEGAHQTATRLRELAAEALAWADAIADDYKTRPALEIVKAA
jgi:hypothetical protein